MRTGPDTSYRRTTVFLTCPGGPLPAGRSSLDTDDVLFLSAGRIGQLDAGPALLEPFDQDAPGVGRVGRHVGDLEIVIEHPVDLLIARHLVPDRFAVLDRDRRRFAAARRYRAFGATAFAAARPAVSPRRSGRTLVGTSTLGARPASAWRLGSGHQSAAEAARARVHAPAKRASAAEAGVSATRSAAHGREATHARHAHTAPHHTHHAAGQSRTTFENQLVVARDGPDILPPIRAFLIEELLEG